MSPTHSSSVPHKHTHVGKHASTHARCPPCFSSGPQTYTHTHTHRPLWPQRCPPHILVQFHTHTRTHLAHPHARTHARTHTHIHTPWPRSLLSLKLVDLDSIAFQI